MRDAGLTPLVSHRADDDGTVLGLVARGAGVACVPRLVAAATDARHAVLELADPMDRRIALAWHVDRVESTALVRFAERTRAMTNRHRVAAIS
jgi:DNA-binding transcriptional LysR family regulator